LKRASAAEGRSKLNSMRRNKKAGSAANFSKKSQLSNSTANQEKAEEKLNKPLNFRCLSL
jgi:hypothetical protein